MFKLSENMLAMLRQPSTCYIATTMPDGSPQITQTWVDTDGEHVIINTVQGYVKLKNIARDPRVAIAISDPHNPTRYLQIRGRVVETTTNGAAEHIERLSHKYTGKPYSWYGGRQQQRVIMVIEPEKVSGIR
jgi:PPOX class probable F420-dependent enzyme